MKKNNFFAFTIGYFLFNTISVFAFETVPTQTLLSSYLENDNSLKSYALDAQKAQLALDSTIVSKGFDISLSTGNFTIKTENDGASISVKPTIQATIPQALNLTISASSAYNYKSDTSTIDDTKVNASIDIISSNGLSRDISLLKAERSVIEAGRRLRNQAINTEKQFYTELKSLLSSTISISNQQNSLYSNKIDFEKIKAQGFTKVSSTYRLAQMKVTSGEHDIEKSTRALIHDYIVFYKKCGYDIEFDDKTDVFDLVPTDISEVIGLNIEDFDPELYSEVENVLWTNKINSMERQTHSNFSLSANGGVTLNNSLTSSTTIDAGLSSKYGGLTMGAGLSFPITNSGCLPIFTLSASISPNTFKQNQISKNQDLLAEQQELVNLETARNNYATKVVDLKQSLADLLWEKKNNEECYDLYSGVEKDLRNYYRQGIITESEYNSARVNTRSYSVKKIINSIDFIIYNDNLMSMFVEKQPGEN